MKNKERVNLKVRLMPLATLLQVFLPRWFSIWLAKILGNIYFFADKDRRCRISDNMRHILGTNSPNSEINNYTRRLFINYSICLADLFRAPLLTKEKLLSMVQLSGKEYLDRTLAKGKGAILISAHIGNWDLAGIFLSRLGYKLTAVVEPIPKGVTSAMNRYRGIGGMELIPLTNKDAIERVLKEKRILVLLADRDLTGRGLEFSCFDAKRSYPKGPAAFALKFKVPIIFGYFVLNPKGSKPYLGVIEPEFDFATSEDFQQDVYNLTKIIVKRINQLIAQYPDQWFVFRADWR
ncbi:MAG: lysophospholipid acyltransferase family protein [candidate division WOR-3 bacterium]